MAFFIAKTMCGEWPISDDGRERSAPCQLSAFPFSGGVIWN